MRNPILAFLPLALLANCSAPAEPTNPDKYYKPQVSDLPGANGPGNSSKASLKPGDPLSPFNKDGTKKAQFPNGVVQRLNAIVMQSKTTIDKYDEVRPSIENAVAAAKAAPGDPAFAGKAKAALTELDTLHKQASDAEGALSSEGQKLLDSHQYYDAVIFSGMAMFVSKVENELADDRKTLGAQLPR